MLTIFSVPKPFYGHIGVIQRNAIRSWTALDPTCQVILCGDEPGADAAAADLGTDRIPDIELNEFGTPLLGSVFEAVEERAKHDLLCYANGDLVFFPDLLDALRVIAAASERFLVVGESTGLDVRNELEPGFEVGLRLAVAETGTSRGPKAIDYFAFPRGSVGPLPAFAVGRPSWDNWMIWNARRRRMPVVDVSSSVLVVHQDHDHRHVPQARGSRWFGPEGNRNRVLAGSDERELSLFDATHRLTPGGPERIPRSLRQRLDYELILHPWVIPLYRPPRRAYHLLRKWLVRAREHRT